MKRRYVNSKRQPKGAPLPKVGWQGRTFVAADGTQYDVVSGKLPSRDWPNGSQPHVRTIGHPVVTP